MAKQKAVKVVDYTTIHWTEKLPAAEQGKPTEREVILIYALGEDGTIYEMSGGRWLPLPIEEGYIRKLDNGN